MNQIILKCLDKSNKRSPIITEMVKGLVLSRDVSSTKHANYITGDAKKESKIKRVERFYAKDYLDQGSAICFLGECMQSERIVASMDRTNWESGKLDVNALVLYGKTENISGMLNVELLDNKGGNSNFSDRKNVLEPVLKRLNGKISVLLCDREFFSFEFINYLIETNTPFVIRIKQNLKFIKALKEDLRSVTLTHRNVMIGKFKDKELHLDLSGKKLGNEYLLTVSYKVHNPLKEYRKRWGIECFFKSLKTSGFNVENTHLKQLKRLRSLFLLCGMAYFMCVLMGIWAHRNITKIKFKKTLNCNQFSLFRYGIDWITQLFFARAKPPALLGLPCVSISRVR